MKVYRGVRVVTYGRKGVTSSHARVTVEEDGQAKPLDPRLDIRSHSPTGFEWGYNGSGPAQLALALVADLMGAAWAVPQIYQQFKADVVAKLPRDGWVLCGDVIELLARKVAADRFGTDERIDFGFHPDSTTDCDEYDGEDPDGSDVN